MTPNTMDDKTFILRFIRYFLSLLLIVALIYAGVKIFPFLLPIFFGLIVARMAAFVSRQMEHLYRRGGSQATPTTVRKRKRIRSVVLYFILVIAFFVLIGWGIGASVESLRNITTQLPSAVRTNNFFENFEESLANVSARLESWGISFLNVDKLTEYLGVLQDRIIANVPKGLTYIVNALSRAAGSLPMASLVIIITIMSGYYFLRDGARFYRVFRRIFPDKLFVRRIFRLIETIIDTLFRIVGGYILILFITFTEAFIGLRIVGFPNAGMWAAIVALVDMLPVLGVSATLIPMSLYMFISGEAWQGFAIVLLLIIMLTARRFFEPLILGGAMRLHPLLTILSMIVGIMLYGLGGILLGPMILVVIQEIMRVFELQDRFRANMRRIFNDADRNPLKKLRIRDLKAADPDAKKDRARSDRSDKKASENTKD